LTEQEPKVHRCKGLDLYVRRQNHMDVFFILEKPWSTPQQVAHGHKLYHTVHNHSIKEVLGFLILSGESIHIQLDFHISVNYGESFEMMNFAHITYPKFQNAESVYTDRLHW
jgi:hypothetical protein